MATNNSANIVTAAAGKVLQGAGIGVNCTFSTPTYPSTSGSSGKVLISDGTNNVYSTPTFPNASATSGKIIKSDGTNWLASTETYAAPGTSGNVMTSDGTNWTSAAASPSYALPFLTSGETGSNPLDARTYFLEFGKIITTSTTAGLNLQKLFIPKAGTLNICYGTCRVGGTLGSAGSSTLSIRLNNTTDTAITSTLAMTAVDNTFSNTSLGISVSAGDYIEFKVDTPTWATNPTLVSFSMVVYIS